MSSESEKERREGAGSVRMALGEFRLLLNSRKIVVERVPADQYPHLTLAWYPQGLVDLHLTYGHADAMRGCSAKQHRAVGSLDSTDLGRLSEYLKTWSERVAERFLALWRPMNPGGLRRNGYDVLLPTNESFAELLSVCAPKSRGKYRVKSQEINNWQNWNEVVDSCLYDPAVLHLLNRNEVDMPLTAIGRKGTVYVLMEPARSPRGRWLGYKQRTAARLFRIEVERLMSDLANVVDHRHAAALELIVNEMRLGGVPSLVQPLNRLRHFLTEPGTFVEECLGSNTNRKAGDAT